MKKNKQSKRNRRILLAILMLSITGVTLATATYAWFSANSAVSATGIDVKVTAATGISIAADAKNFGKTIDMAEVISFSKDKNLASTMQLPEKLNPVSTAGLPDASTAFTFYTGELGDNPDVVLLDGSAESYTVKSGDYTYGDFIAFDIYIRSSVQQALRLNSNTAISAIGTDTGNLQTALRLGFLPLGTSTDTGATTSQAAAYALATPAADWKIYNPYPYSTHASSLAGYGKDSEGTQLTEATAGYYGAASSTKTVDALTTKGEEPTETEKQKDEHHYVKFLHKDIDSSNIPAYLKLLDSNNNNYIQGQADNNYLPSENIFTVGAGITKVRVYVWLEGNDVDCVDAISISDGLRVNLGFEIAK